MFNEKIMILFVLDPFLVDCLGGGHYKICIISTDEHAISLTGEDHLILLANVYSTDGSQGTTLLLRQGSRVTEYSTCRHSPSTMLPVSPRYSYRAVQASLLETYMKLIRLTAVVMISPKLTKPTAMQLQTTSRTIPTKLTHSRGEISSPSTSMDSSIQPMSMIRALMRLRSTSSRLALGMMCCSRWLKMMPFSSSSLTDSPSGQMQREAVAKQSMLMPYSLINIVLPTVQEQVPILQIIRKASTWYIRPLPSEITYLTATDRELVSSLGSGFQCRVKWISRAKNIVSRPRISMNEATVSMGWSNPIRNANSLEVPLKSTWQPSRMPSSRPIDWHEEAMVRPVNSAADQLSSPMSAIALKIPLAIIIRERTVTEGQYRQIKRQLKLIISCPMITENLRFPYDFMQKNYRKIAKKAFIECPRLPIPSSILTVKLGMKVSTANILPWLPRTAPWTMYETSSRIQSQSFQPDRLFNYWIIKQELSSSPGALAILDQMLRPPLLVTAHLLAAQRAHGLASGQAHALVTPIPHVHCRLALPALPEAAAVGALAQPVRVQLRNFDDKAALALGGGLAGPVQVVIQHVGAAKVCTLHAALLALRGHGMHELLVELVLVGGLCLLLQHRGVPDRLFFLDFLWDGECSSLMVRLLLGLGIQSPLFGQHGPCRISVLRPGGLLSELPYFLVECFGGVVILDTNGIQLPVFQFFQLPA